jgi:hypothetical protein
VEYSNKMTALGEATPKNTEKRNKILIAEKP